MGGTYNFVNIIIKYLLLHCISVYYQTLIIGSSLLISFCKIEPMTAIFYARVINMNIDYNVICKRIKQARKDNNKTQDDLAEILYVSNSYISRIEIVTAKLILELLVRICTYLNISPSHVLTGSISSSDDYLRNDIVNMLKRCSSDNIKLIVEVIKPINLSI